MREGCQTSANLLQSVEVGEEIIWSRPIVRLIQNAIGVEKHSSRKRRPAIPEEVVKTHQVEGMPDQILILYVNARKYPFVRLVQCFGEAPDRLPDLELWMQTPKDIQLADSPSEHALCAGRQGIFNLDT